MYRLVPFANVPDKLKLLIVAAFNLYERITFARRIPGPFCSELVARVYERMGLHLFDKDPPAAEISPNQLAKSNLIKQEQIVISSHVVAGF